VDANRVKTECGILRVTDSRGCDGAVIVGIRPEDVRLGRSSNDDENRIEGKVVNSTFLGDQVVAEVKINEQTLIAKTLPDDGKPAENTSVHLPTSKLVVFPDLSGAAILVNQ